MVHVVHAHPMRPGHSVKSKRVETAVMFVQHIGQSSASRYPCRMTDDPDQVEPNWRCGKCPPNTLWVESQVSLHARPLSVWRFDSRWRLSQRMEELCSHAPRVVCRMWQPTHESLPVVRPIKPCQEAPTHSTAFHSRRQCCQCYADVYTHCNTRSRWQNSPFSTQCGVQGWF